MCLILQEESNGHFGQPNTNSLILPLTAGGCICPHVILSNDVS